jgi:serine protease AprX
MKRPFGWICLMQEVRKRVGAANAYQLGLYGQQIGIAVLDSGIYLHPDFIKGQNRILAFKDFITQQTRPFDHNGHGTHIAGIIAGSGVSSSGRHMGMAPLSNLIVLKILDDKGNGSVENVCRAVDWTVKNKTKYNIRIMNISVGANTGERRRESSLLVDAVEYAWDHGIVVVAAAGNNGPGPMSITSPGTSRKIITVGASPENVQHFKNQQCRFSGRGPTESCVCKPDLVAPGFRIWSCSHLPEVLYTVRSGTSMAAPVVSGGIALLLSGFPDLSNKEVKIWLRKNARSLSQPREYQGWGQFYISEASLKSL